MCNVRYILCEICIESWSEISFVISLPLLLTKNWEIFPNNSCITTKILIIDNNSIKLEESYTIEALVVKICVMSDAFQLKLVLNVDSLQISLQLLLKKTEKSFLIQAVLTIKYSSLIIILANWMNQTQ